MHTAVGNDMNEQMIVNSNSIDVVAILCTVVSTARKVHSAQQWLYNFPTTVTKIKYVTA